jgi:hypothetical protein
MWIEVHKGHPIGRELADRHYSRQTPGAAMYTRPGFNQVLLYEDKKGAAVFVWWRPKWEDPRPGTDRKDGLRAIECTLFRNESSVLSSEMIKAAAEEVIGWEHALDTEWPDGLITGVSSKATSKHRGRNNKPGHCFRMAGWIEISGKRTKRADTWLTFPMLRVLELSKVA